MTAVPPLPQLEGLDVERPWLGLASFEEKHKPLFFGREADVDELLLRIDTQPLTTFYGKPGLGKTSLLRAGLIPRLRELHDEIAYFRLDYNAHAALPSVQLSEKLTAGYVFPSDFREPAASQPNPGDDPLSRLWFWAHDRNLGGQRSVVLLDQFEEIVTLGGSREKAEDDLRAVLATLVQGAVPPALQPWLRSGISLSKHFAPSQRRVRVVLSLRHDYLYFLDLWRHQLPGIMDNRMELFALRGLQALDAAYRPGALRCDDLPAVANPPPPILSGETAEAIIRHLADVGPDISARRIIAVPPYVSLLCYQLNEERIARREPQAVLPPGTDVAEQLIANYYEERTASIPGPLIDWLERHLIKQDGTRVPILASDLATDRSVPKALRAVARAILETLTKRLLLVGQPYGKDDHRYELIHDLLVPVVIQNRTRREADVATERERQRKEKMQKLALEANRRAHEAKEAAKREKEARTEADRLAGEALQAVESEKAAKKTALEAEEKALRAARDAEAAANRELEARINAEKNLDSRIRAWRVAKWLGWSAVGLAFALVVALVLTVRLLRASNAARKDLVDAQRSEFTLRKKLEETVTESKRLETEARIQAKTAHDASTKLEKEKGERLAREAAEGRRDHTTAKEKLQQGEWTDAVAYYCSSLRHAPRNPAALLELWFTCRHGAAAQAIVPEDFVELPAIEGIPLWSPDGRFLAARKDLKSVVFIDRREGNAIYTPEPLPATVAHTAFSQDSRRALVAVDRGGWRSYSLEASKLEFANKAPTRTLLGSPFSPDGELLITQETDGEVRLVSTTSGTVVRSIKFSGALFGAGSDASRTIREGIWSPAGDRIAVRTNDGRIAVLDPKTGDRIGKAITETYMGLGGFDNTGRLLLAYRMPFAFTHVLSIDRPRPVAGWNPAARCLKFTTALAGSALSALMAPHGIDRLELRRLERDGYATAVDVPFKNPNSCSFSQDGSVLLIYGGERQMQLFSVPLAEPLSALQHFDLGPNAGSLSPDGSLIARVGAQPGLEIWKAPPALLFLANRKAFSRFGLKEVSPDGEWKVALADPEHLQVHYLGKPQFETRLRIESCEQAGWLPQGRTLVFIYPDGTIRELDWTPPITPHEEVQKSLQLIGGKTLTEDGDLTPIPFDQAIQWRKRMEEAKAAAGGWAPLVEWWLKDRKMPEGTTP